MQSMLALSMMLAGQPLPAPFIRRRPEPPRTLEDFEHPAEPLPKPPPVRPTPPPMTMGFYGVEIGKVARVERPKRRPTAERKERRRVRKQRRRD